VSECISVGQFKQLETTVRDQNKDQYNRIEALEEGCTNMRARIFGNGGDDTGTHTGRLRKVEGTVEKIETFMIEEQAAQAVACEQDAKDRKERQAEVDKQRHRTNLLIAVIGLVIAAAALCPQLA